MIRDKIEERNQSKKINTTSSYIKNEDQIGYKKINKMTTLYFGDEKRKKKMRKRRKKKVNQSPHYLRA